jgi:hypothetical protein
MSNKKAGNRGQNVLDQFQDPPVISWFIIVGISVIAIGQFINAIKEFTPFISPSPMPGTRIFAYAACPDEPCTDANAHFNYPKATTKFYLSWKFEIKPINSHFVRIWNSDDEEWVKSDCSWPGPVNGEAGVAPLIEPGGFLSGSWVMTIDITNEVASRSEPITVEGDHDYWVPVHEPVHSCYKPAPIKLPGLQHGIVL